MASKGEEKKDGKTWRHTQGLVYRKLTEAEESSVIVECIALYYREGILEAFRGLCH